jgi:hypothetical protein
MFLFLYKAYFSNIYWAVAYSGGSTEIPLGKAAACSYVVPSGIIAPSRHRQPFPASLIPNEWRALWLADQDSGKSADRSSLCPEDDEESAAVFPRQLKSEA